MSDQETGRGRASRIPLDYHHKWDFLSRAKWWGVGIATLAAVAYIATGASLDGPAAVRYSHGPVAAAHAAWETSCEACHVAFQPIRADSIATPWTDLHASDAKCQACHAGPAHHANQIDSEVASCAACHQDHQGRLADLKRVSDQACTHCHAEPDKHRRGQSALEPPLVAVTSFPDGHPDFRSLARDPGTIKFTHQRHMARGLISAEPDKTREQPFRGEDWRQRAGEHAATVTNWPDEELVQLDCSNCHRPEPSGRYMAAITYENDCRSCHPLRISPESDQTIPHGLGGEAVRGWLLNSLWDQLADDEEGAALRNEPPQRPLPGKRYSQSEQRALSQLATRVAQTEKHLQSMCSLCHTVEAVAPTNILPALATGAPSQPIHVAEAAMPTVWLNRARFDHQAHRAVKCLECHSAADQSRAASDVLVDRRKAICAKCHAPAGQTASGLVGGARHDCAECHLYHGADQPHRVNTFELRGVDAASRKTIEAFLSGGKVE